MGLLRLVLASMVVLHHLLAFPFIGHHAVLFFFTISGYLMTLVMQNRYGYSGHGLRRFWMNRALRLYPAYIAVLVVSVLIIFLVSEEVSSTFRKTIYLPSTLGEGLQNLTMLYVNLFPNEVAPRMSPPTWALTVELVYYILISLGLSRSRQITLAWFTASGVYVAWCLLSGQPSSYLYFSIFAGSLPFSAGAMIYHFRDRWEPLMQGRESKALLASGVLLIGIIAVRALVRVKLDEDAFESLSLVLTTVPAALAVGSLLLRPWSLLPQKLDVMAGDLSYPLYISHWILGLAIASILGIAQPNLGPDGLLLVALTWPAAMLVSWLIVTQIDHRVERMRRRIRSAAQEAI